MASLPFGNAYTAVDAALARAIPRHIDRSAALTDDLRRIAAVAAADVADMSDAAGSPRRTGRR
jgi:hypothetical protein